VSLLHAGSYTLRAYSIIPEHWPTVPPQHLAEIDPRAIPALDLPPPQKIGSPSFFFIFFSSFFQCSTTPLPPRILTHDGPCFKLADQSPKPLGHRNWPRILFLLDLWWGGGGGCRCKPVICLRNARFLCQRTNVPRIPWLYPRGNYSLVGERIGINLLYGKLSMRI